MFACIANQAFLISGLAIVTVSSLLTPLMDSVTVVGGESTVLPCGGDDESPFEARAVRWHHRPPGGHTAAEEVGTGPDSRLQILGDNSLFVDGVEPQDEGRFTCTDDTTGQLRAVFDIKVRKPSVIRLETNADDSGGLREGDTFHMSCRVVTDSAAQSATMLIWRDTGLLDPDDPRVTLNTHRDHNTWEVAIQNITRRDAGSYICRAKTFYDRAEAEIPVTVAPRVEADCTTDWTELRWSADAPAPGGFLVRMLVDSTPMDEALVPGNMTSVEVHDLGAGSEVRFEVEAADEPGSVPGVTTCFVAPKDNAVSDNSAE